MTRTASLLFACLLALIGAEGSAQTSETPSAAGPPEDQKAAPSEPQRSVAKETIGMFGAAQLQRMKKTAYLVNTARGGIVDEGALYAALTAGTLAGAGIDVFDSEM
jgi:D-isomer specific 2-hydroxyacid dehydrogenase, NAD binding domain